MPLLTPSSAEELAETLREAASKSQTITALGANSKRLMAGPLLPSDVTISTSKLRRVLQYEPNDLTVSVEAGMPFAELQKLLAARGQMLALDPPHSADATVGGVIATNSSGPVRRAFGTARDLVIGMTFATLEGKLVKTGGMVVKNVAGLDMSKLMIGSFGTLAVLTSVNLRVHARPAETRAFFFCSSDLESALEKRAAVLRGVLQPLAVDLLSPAAATRLGTRGFMLAVRAGGSPTVLARYARELPGSETLTGDRDAQFWNQMQAFTPDFLRRQPGGIVLRTSTTLSEIGDVFRLVTGACISRAASGVSYIYVTSWQAVAPIWKAATERGWSAVVEYAPEEIRASKELWLLSSDGGEPAAFAMMKKVKQMFDPSSLLNRNRLYGRI
ncbi:MAG: FAD-binding oxidoreductase [Acidobacteriaceae bacterium]|nr:FAD-binding oxidoreductase [Acidobacteriaceae bacterium]